MARYQQLSRLVDASHRRLMQNPSQQTQIDIKCFFFFQWVGRCVLGVTGRPCGHQGYQHGGGKGRERAREGERGRERQREGERESEQEERGRERKTEENGDD